MPGLRIRKPFAAAFALLLLAAAYLGLSTQKIPSYGQSDKGLHFITFFLLTATFYFAPELPRRRAIHLTLLTCTAGLAIGSEIAQALLPNGRDFDPLDIAANVVGSTLALLLCSWYHKRMLERRRRNKHYDIVPGEALEDGEENGERDVELGDVGREGAEEREEGGTVAVGGETGPGQADAGATAASKATNVTEELDNWDENEADWDDGDDVAATTDTKAQETSGGAVDPVPKRRMD